MEHIRVKLLLTDLRVVSEQVSVMAEKEDELVIDKTN